jgi:predicted dehydrogenase
MALRFGVAGTGYWAEAVHLTALATHPEAKLVGVWGRNPEKVAALAAKFGIAPFGSFDEMLAQTDAISIALPPHIQAGHALAAADAGKHLLLEKPLAMTPASAHAIAASIERRGLASIVFFMRRFVTEIENAIQLARQESWNEGSVQVHSRALIGDSPYAGSVWRQAEAGALWDIGPHVLSVLMPVLGDIESARATLGADRYVRFSTRHVSGATADVSVTLHAEPSAVTSRYVFRRPERELTLPEPELARPALYAQAVSDLVGAVRSGKTAHRCDVRLGVRVVEALAAAARSLETGAAVEVTAMGV